MLSDGLHDVPAGKLAAVVTHLEMTAPPPPRPMGDCPAGLRFDRIEAPSPAFYRDLFTRVGTRDWLWVSRLQMEDAALEALLSDPGVRLWSLWEGDTPQAMLELDFRGAGECELAYFGVAAPLIGRGAGRYLMNRALALAWAEPIARLHVHTCTLDSAGALGFYRRSGFTPIRQQIEIFEDPRVTGHLPESYGPHVPILRGTDHQAST